MKKKLTIAALAVILLTLVLSVVYVHKQITMETAHNGFIPAGDGYFCQVLKHSPVHVHMVLTKRTVP